MDSTTWLTKTELLARVQHEATERQLERWHKSGLIPRPQRHSLGRGKGYRSDYPPGTYEQLVALLELRRSERRLHRLRFALWCQGYPIPLGAIKATVEKLAFGSVHQLRGEIRGKTPAEAAADAAAWVMPDLLHSRMGRNMRKRLGSEAAIQRLFTAMIQLGLGGGHVFTQPETLDTSGQQSVAELLLRALGLDTARTVGIGDAGPWLTGDPATMFSQLEPEAAFSYDRMQQALREASHEALERARQDGAIFIPGMVSMVQALHATESPEVFGWLFQHAPTHDPTLQAQMMIQLLVARQELGDVAVDSIIAVLSAQQQAREMATAMADAVPDITPYLNLESGLQALNALDPAVLEALQQQIRTLLTSHPQWAAILAEPVPSPDTMEPETGTDEK